MRTHWLARSHAYWHRLLFVLALAISMALGGAGISANDSGQNNLNGGLGSPPPTNTPTPTVAPTATPTTAPTTDAATPTGNPAAPASPASGSSTGQGSDTNASDNQGSIERDESGGAPNNIVKVINKKDGKFRLKGKIQINHIPGDTAKPVNDAEAYSSCMNCETFAIALQVDLISRTATTIAPQNTAIAVNYQCTNCHTVARAVQYVIQVDDPTQVPDDVNNLVDRMQQELNAAAHDKNATVAQTESRVNAVIAQFTQFAQSLNDQGSQENQNDTPGGSVPSDATP